METRNKMMASGTKPMPAGMENRQENRDEMRDKLMQRASTTQGNMQERRDEMKEKMQERKSEILKRHAANMVRQMRAAIGRISKLADRVDSRIAKMKERGADTSAAETNIAIARTKITEASAAVKLAEDAIAGAVVAADVSASSTAPASDPGKAVREALNKAKEAMFAAHKALVEAIKSLKGIRIDVVATTTASTGATTTTP
jgi:vacuolar-type H+-ATPase subunit D/Vma8